MEWDRYKAPRYLSPSYVSKMMKAECTIIEDGKKYSGPFKRAEFLRFVLIKINNIIPVNKKKSQLANCSFNYFLQYLFQS